MTLTLPPAPRFTDTERRFLLEAEQFGAVQMVPDLAISEAIDGDAILAHAFEKVSRQVRDAAAVRTPVLYSKNPVPWHGGSIEIRARSFDVLAAFRALANAYDQANAIHLALAAAHDRNAFVGAVTLKPDAPALTWAATAARAEAARAHHDGDAEAARAWLDRATAFDAAAKAAR